MKPKHTDLDAHLALMDQLPLRTSCAFCGWSCEGSALECREKAVQHRLRAHPEAVKLTKRRRGNHKGYAQQRLTKTDWKEIYAERDKRAFLNGIEVAE